MSIRNQTPQKPQDAPIQIGDTGEAVKLLQQFLQNDSRIKKEIELLGSIRPEGQFSLLDGKQYGNFTKETRDALNSWQQIHEKEIIRISNGNVKDIRQVAGKLDFYTWKLISKDVQEDNSYSPPPLSDVVSEPAEEEEVLKDPPKVNQSPDSSHYVKTKDPKSRLALREAPAFVAVSKNAWEDVDKKGKLFKMLNNDTLLKIIEPGVGYKCEWHQVEVTDSSPLHEDAREKQKKIPLYVYAEFVQSLNGTPDILPIRCCEENASPSVVFESEWMLLDECEPFIDECNYCITVTLDDTRTSEALLPQQKKRALRVGVEGLLEFYDKKRDELYVNALLDSYQFAFVPENGWFLDERPESNIKFLVKIPSKYFDAIPDVIEEFDELAIIEGRLPKDWRSTHFSTHNLKSNIEVVAKRLEEYAIDVDNWEGELSDIDLREEARRIRMFPAVLREFILLNGFEYREDEEDTIEVGFEGECFNLIYVLANKFEKAISLRIGLECFKKKEPIKFQRTMGYVFYLDEMVRSIKKEKSSWLTFIQNYTCPIPEINPSRRKKQIERFDKLDEIKNFLNDIDCNPEKSLKEKLKEDTTISDAAYKLHAALKRSKESENIEDAITRCDNLADALEKVSDLIELYRRILNKIDIDEIIALISAFMSARLDPEEIERIACQLAFEQLSSLELDDVIYSLSDEFQSEINLKISSSLTKLPAGSTEISADIKRKSIMDAVPESTLCRQLYTLIPDVISEIVIKISPPKIPTCDEVLSKLPNIPVIVLPDDLLTEDIMKDIVPSIENAIKNAITKALIVMLKNILASLCNSSSGDTDFRELHGDENLNNILDNFGNTNIDGGLRYNSEDITNNVLSELGIPDESLEKQKISNLFDDLSSILLPSELCMLLDGGASEEIINIIINLINKNYSDLSEYLGSKGQLKLLFKKLSFYVDSDVCEKILAREEKNNFELCDDQEFENTRKILLKDKMSPEQVKEQIKRLKDRQSEQIKNIVRLSQGDFLKNIIPPIIDEPCENKQGIIPKDPPSLDFINDKVIKTMFDGVHMAFNQDIANFIDALVEDKNIQNFVELDVSNKEFKKSHAARLKEIDDIDEEDTDALLRNPLASGEARGQTFNVVAPEVFKLLKDEKNFSHFFYDIHSPKAEYIYKTDMVSVLERIQEIKKEFFKDREDRELAFRRVLNVVSSPDLNIEQKIANVRIELGKTKAITEQVFDRRAEIEKWIRQNSLAGGETFTPKPSPICFPDLPEIDKAVIELEDFARRNLIDNTIVIEYSLPSYDGDKNFLKDKYFLKIHDPFVEDPIIFSQEEEIDKQISDLIKDYSIKQVEGVSMKQEIFAEIVKRVWGQIVDSREFIEKETDFYNFFRDTMFHRVTNWFIFRFSRQTATSPLFDRKKLESLELIPDPNDDEEILCPPKTKEFKSLLNMDEIKDKVKKDYLKKISICSKKQEENVVTEFEKAGLGGVVQVMIKLFVIDVFLRGVFSWSEFKIKDTLADGTIYKFIIEKIKRELKEEGEEFYKRFAIEARDHLFARGDRLVDPFLGDPTDLDSEEDKVLSDPLHPDTQSGDAAVEFLIKEQLKPVSDVVEEIIGSPDIKDLDEMFSEEWLTTTGTRTRLFEDSRDVKRYLKENIGGPFVIEYYARVCRENTKNGVVEVVDNRISDNERLSYGARLVFVPSLDPRGKKNKNVFEDISFLDEKMVKDEKTFKFNKIQSDFLRDEEKSPDVFPFPLIIAEEEEIRTGRTSLENEEEIFKNLKKQIIDSSEWKVLFHYCFPLKRFLSLNAIYTMMATSVAVEDIDDTFEGTRNALKQLQYILLPPSEEDVEWWNKESPNIEGMGGNLGIRTARMGNVTTKGTNSFLIKMAQATIGIIIKGMAERYDPSYKLIKKLNDRGVAIDGLNWGTVPQVMPINIFGPLGYGPPLGMWGALALGVPMLSGERKADKRRKIEFEMSKADPEKCDEGEEE